MKGFDVNFSNELVKLLEKYKIKEISSNKDVESFVKKVDGEWIINGFYIKSEE